MSTSSRAAICRKQIPTSCPSPSTAERLKTKTTTIRSAARPAAFCSRLRTAFWPKARTATVRRAMASTRPVAPTLTATRPWPQPRRLPTSPRQASPAAPPPFPRRPAFARSSTNRNRSRNPTPNPVRAPPILRPPEGCPLQVPVPEPYPLPISLHRRPSTRPPGPLGREAERSGARARMPAEAAAVARGRGGTRCERVAGTGPEGAEVAGRRGSV